MEDKGCSIHVVGLDTGYISKSHTTVVTRDVNASLFSGELTCLLGPNGAGKSTLLRTLNAFQPPVKGDIIIHGKAISDYTDAELAKLIGVVLTEKPSVSNTTAEELIALGRSPYTGFWGRLSSRDKEIVNEAINLVGIGSLRHRIVQTLSDGERQKVMIAKALAQETPIIFLDEPTAFLDYPSKVETMQLLQRLSRERNTTVFLSTHDLELALQIADKVWLLDKTHGVTVGTPEDVALDGALTKYFHREGIEFDTESGQFRIVPHIRCYVALEGTHPQIDMAHKALARYGIGTSTTDSGNTVICATADGFYVDGVRLQSIEQMLEAVRRLKIYDV